jgi:hypothetical protein
MRPGAFHPGLQRPRRFKPRWSRANMASLTTCHLFARLPGKGCRRSGE